MNNYNYCLSICYTTYTKNWKISVKLTIYMPCCYECDAKKNIKGVKDVKQCVSKRKYKQAITKELHIVIQLFTFLLLTWRSMNLWIEQTLIPYFSNLDLKLMGLNLVNNIYRESNCTIIVPRKVIAHMLRQSHSLIA